MNFWEDNFEKLKNDNIGKPPIETKEYILIEPNNYQYSFIKTSNIFEHNVLTHIVSLYLPDNHYFQAPMFLAIEGRAGEGKTTQTIATCSQHGIYIIYISASELSGAHEKDSINVMKKIYSAAIGLRNSGKVVAILIDDFHMGNATTDENVRKTINSNLLTGHLMNLAENNNKIKIPIILTGNDFSKTYAPLLRSGRADKFEWNPNYEEKKEIVKTIFYRFANISEQEFNELFDKYANNSISDFYQLINEYRKILFSEYITKFDIIDKDAIYTISQIVKQHQEKINYDLLNQLADSRMKEVKKNERIGIVTAQSRCKCRCKLKNTSPCFNWCSL